jgi:nucleoside 2-deoxyribosyltransferase
MSGDRPTVYLAGPIAGLNYAGATDWRGEAARQLEPKGIKTLSPMRATEHLSDLQDMPKWYGNSNPFTTDHSIMVRDRFDATRCDVLLVNLLGAKSVSMGTVMEIAWADLCRTPIVCVMEEGNVHEHGMVNEAIGYRVATLEHAVQVVKAILL